MSEAVPDPSAGSASCRSCRMGLLQLFGVLGAPVLSPGSAPRQLNYTE